MTRDVLFELGASQIDLATACDIVDQLVTDFHSGARTRPLRELLQMSDEEYTAFAHGAPLDVLARWRKEGWPSSCARCGTPIVLASYGWLPRDFEGVVTLIHVSCPPRP